MKSDTFYDAKFCIDFSLLVIKYFVRKKFERISLILTNNMNEIELFGFSGKLGTGKNYISEKLFLAMLPKKNTLVMALADHFKVECCAKDKIKYEKVFVAKDDETRYLLQKRGTEEGRNKYGEDIWVKTLETWIRVYRERGVERFIITDLRFPNEVEWVKSKGGVTFRVEAPGRNLTRLKEESAGDEAKMDLIRNHSSEVTLDGYPNFDYVINNDYEDQPYVANYVRNIIRELVYKEPVKLTIFCDLDDTICKCKEFYQSIIESVTDEVKRRTRISDNDLYPILKKHVMSFERRYYTREDFAHSLVKVAMEAFLQQDIVMQFDNELRDQIYNLGLNVYNQTYDPLYPDSLDQVRELSKYGQVVIFTLGDHTEQMKKIVNLGLLDHQIEIFTHKDENMFRYLQNKYPSDNYVMIGDSFHRDIVPAMQAGIEYLVHISPVPLGPEIDIETRERIFRVEKLNGELMDYLRDLNKEIVEDE